MLIARSIRMAYKQPILKPLCQLKFVTLKSYKWSLHTMPYVNQLSASDSEEAPKIITESKRSGASGKTTLLSASSQEVASSPASVKATALKDGAETRPDTPQEETSTISGQPNAKHESASLSANVYLYASQNAASVSHNELSEKSEKIDSQSTRSELLIDPSKTAASSVALYPVTLYPGVSSPNASSPDASSPAASSADASSPAASSPAASFRFASSPAASFPPTSSLVSSSSDAPSLVASSAAAPSLVASSSAPTSPVASSVASSPAASSPAASSSAASSSAASSPAASSPVASSRAASSPDASSPAAAAPSSTYKSSVGDSSPSDSLFSSGSAPFSYSSSSYAKRSMNRSIENKSLNYSIISSELKWPDREQLEKYSFRVTVIVWDTSVYLFSVGARLFNEYVLKQPVLQEYWDTFKKKMDKARQEMRSK